MKPIMLAFSGPMRSGKSSVSWQIAKILNWPRASFGEYIRMQARREGRSESRESLQHLGSFLIKTQGWEKFCRSVLEQSDWRPGEPIVVDGIRHLEALETMRHLTALSEVHLVYVSLDEYTQAQRMLGNEVATVEDLQRVEADPTEEQVKTVLPKIADVTVDGTQPQEELVREIISIVDHRLSTSDTNELGDPPEEYSELPESEADGLLASARLRGVANKERLLEAEGGTLEATEVGMLLDTPEEAVEAQRLTGKLIALPVDHKRYVYPKWQFQDRGTLPGLKQVLAVLHDHDAWMQTAFMLNSNTRLHGETPLTMLRQGRIAEVLRAARSYGEHGAA
jgi:shikimate kinase